MQSSAIKATRKRSEMLSISTQRIWGYIRGRGGTFCGRGSGPFSYQQQEQYFQDAPQSEKKSGSTANQNWYVNYEYDTVKAKISNQPPFKAGNSRNCIFEWQKLSSDPEVLDFVQHWHIEIADNPCKYSQMGRDILIVNNN